MIVGVLNPENIGLKGGKTSVMVVMALYALQSPYKIPGLLPKALIFYIV